MRERLKNRKTTAFDVVNVALVTLITVVVAYPLYFCVIASLSDPTAVGSGPPQGWMKHLTQGAERGIGVEKEQLRG